MMAMLDLIDDGSELAAVPAVQAGAEDLGNLVGVRWLKISLLTTGMPST
jgi:hypothetical protein